MYVVVNRRIYISHDRTASHPQSILVKVVLEEGEKRIGKNRRGMGQLQVEQQLRLKARRKDGAAEISPLSLALLPSLSPKQRGIRGKERKRT